jgi:hypothetical protein
MNPNQIENLRRRAAELAVAASTVRGSPTGTVRAARRALQTVRLEAFVVSSRTQFLDVLEHETRRVRSRLPRGARHWGIARKILNIYLRSCVYSRPLAEAYRLTRIERWLELPLDSQVARGAHACSDAKLPRWRTVKGLTRKDSAAFQKAAVDLAAKLRVYPIHFEACWWRETVERCECCETQE